MNASDEIRLAIPHREPFLLIDTIVSMDDRSIECEKTFTGDEFFFAGHYPGHPLVPGVLLCEAAMQAGAVWISKQLAATGGMTDQANPADLSGFGGKIPVATRLSDVRFKQMVHPGDTIRVRTELKERLDDVFFMKARVTVAVRTAVRLEFACAIVAQSE